MAVQIIFAFDWNQVILNDILLLCHNIAEIVVMQEKDDSSPLISIAVSINTHILIVILLTTAIWYSMKRHRLQIFLLNDLLLASQKDNDSLIESIDEICVIVDSNMQSQVQPFNMASPGNANA